MAYLALVSNLAEICGREAVHEVFCGGAMTDDVPGPWPEIWLISSGDDI